MLIIVHLYECASMFICDEFVCVLQISIYRAYIYSVHSVCLCPWLRMCAYGHVLYNEFVSV